VRLFSILNGHEDNDLSQKEEQILESFDIAVTRKQVSSGIKL